METKILINYNDYEKKLSNAKQKLKNLKPVLSDFERYYKSLIQKNYYTRGSIFGEWEKNTLKYEKRKRKLVANKTIMSNGKPAIRLEPMRLTDELRKQVFSKNAVKINEDSILYTINNVAGCVWHKTRPFLFAVKEKDGMRIQDKIKFLKMVEKYLERENEQNNNA